MHYSAIGGVIAAVLVVVGLYMYAQSSATHTPEVPAWVREFSVASTSVGGSGEVEQQSTPVTGMVRITPGVERWYTHDNPRFSFQLPDGYQAPDIETGKPGVHGVYVSNSAGSELVVYVYPISSGVRVDEPTIRAYLPEHTIAAFTETVVGTLVRGVKFYSKQQDGAVSVHTWAAYNGFVYMIQAPVADEPLFNFILERWVFAPPVPSAPVKN
jgi:hypothetical protein